MNLQDVHVWRRWVRERVLAKWDLLSCNDLAGYSDFAFVNAGLKVEFGNVKQRRSSIAPEESSL